MDYLKEIVTIVDKNKTKHIEIIGDKKSKDRKLYGLYEGILSGEFESDIQACNKLYGTTEMDKGYRNLKSRLEKKVINTLFFIDFTSIYKSESQRAYYDCYKKVAAVKFLIGGGARKTSMKLAEKTLGKALQFEFFDIAIILTKDLRKYYGTLLGDQKMFNKYNNLLKQVTQDNIYEDRVIEMYTFISSQFVKSKTIQANHIQVVKTYCDELKEYLQKTNGQKFHFYSFLIFALRYEIENQYDKVTETCEEALTYLRANKCTSSTQIFAFIFKRLTCNIPLKNYQLVKQDILECFELVSEGSINWFLTSQVYILLLFHTEKFQEAFDFFNQVKSVFKKKKSKLEVGNDYWNIIEAYMNYFIRIEKIKLPEGKRRPRFDYNDFMKKGKSSSFAKDKRGMNVTILVLQILFLLNEKKENKVIDRMEPLVSYTSKYLRQNATFRSNCFIKMIAKISEANFNRIALERRTKNLYKKLQSKPLEVSEQPIEMEIVPFEMLWEMVLDSLDRRPTNRKKVSYKRK